MSELLFVFCLLSRYVVFGASDVILRLLLGYLSDEVFVRAFLIQVVLRLCMRIEFDKDVAFLYVGARWRQLGDDHRTDLSPFEPRRKHHKGTRGLRGPIEPQRLRKVLSFHLDDGFFDTDGRSPGPEI